MQETWLLVSLKRALQGVTVFRGVGWFFVCAHVQQPPAFLFCEHPVTDFPRPPSPTMLAGIHAEVQAALIEALPDPPARRGGARVPREDGAIAFMAIFAQEELPDEVRFYITEFVARNAAVALAAPLPAPFAAALAPPGGVVAWWGAAARGRDVLPLLRHFPPAVRTTALAALRRGDFARASDAAIERYRRGLQQ